MKTNFTKLMNEAMQPCANRTRVLAITPRMQFCVYGYNLQHGDRSSEYQQTRLLYTS